MQMSWPPLFHFVQDSSGILCDTPLNVDSQINASYLFGWTVEFEPMTMARRGCIRFRGGSEQVVSTAMPHTLSRIYARFQ